MAKTPKKKRGYHAGKIPGMNYIKDIQLRKQMEESATDFAKDETQRVLADRQAQRTVWAYIIALNEKFSFGPKRTEELEAAVQQITDDYKQMVKDYDQDYADEALRRRVSQVRGHEVKYLYEDQYPVNNDRKVTDVSEEGFASMRESDSRIY